MTFWRHFGFGLAWLGFCATMTVWDGWMVTQHPSIITVLVLTMSVTCVALMIVVLRMRLEVWRYRSSK